MYNYDTYMKTETGMITLNNTSSDLEIMTGATAESDGKSGLVPAPVSKDKDKYFKGDGTWSDIDNKYAKRSIYFENWVSLGRKEGTSIGAVSFAFGTNVESSGNYSHAEGNATRASAESSHAEGFNTWARNIASHACGKFNIMILGDDVGTAFAIGNGLSSSEKSNAFSVTFNGTTKSANTITASTTADYAEFFEWNDGNPNNEDRVGKFVTLDGDKISIAKSNEDYILGIVSGAPFVLGNGDCDVWNGMYMRDDFGRLIYEPAPKEEFDEETGTMKEVFDEDGNLIYEGKRRKLNPDYDPSQKYISRFDRPEWSPIGMLGVLSVIQDGTCAVNGYCCCNNEGIATACDRDTIGSYRVIKKISDQVVRVVFR